MSTKKAEARERVKAMREEQARKERARERMMRFGIAAAVLVAVAIIAVAVVSSNDGGDGDGDVAVPAVAGGENDGILVGDPQAPVTIENWMDFLCPHCQEFEQTNGATISQWIESGEVNVIYNPVTYTGGVNSGRANNAFACAADEGQAKEFLDAAFAAPQEWTNNSLVDLGRELNIGGGFESCVRDETYSSWSSSMTSAARGAGVEGTPTIFVNGELVNDRSPQGMAAAVQAAGANLSGPQEEQENDGQEEAGDGEDAADDTESAESDDNAGADED